MTYAVLQGWGATGGANTAAGAPTTANLASGSKIIFICEASGGSAVSFADSNGNNIPLLLQIAGNTNQHCYIYVIDTPAADAGTKPTFTFTQTSGGGTSFNAIEVMGLTRGTTALIVDGTAGTVFGTFAANGSTGSPFYASSAAGELLIAAYADDGSAGATTWTAPGGYSIANGAINSTGAGNAVICWKNSTGGIESDGYSVTTPGNDHWGLFLLAFTLAPSPPLPARQMPNMPYIQVFRAGGGSS